MSKKILIELEGTWVLSHRGDDVLPIEFLKAAVLRQYGDALSLQSSGHTAMTLAVREESADVASLADGIKALFLSHYGQDADTVITVTVETKGESGGKQDSTLPQNQGDTAEGESGKEGAKPDGDKQKSSKGLAALLAAHKSGNGAEKPAAVLPSHDDIVGGEEFKALVAELRQIAPQIIENSTFDTFRCQTYLFSINDGYGLSTYLALLRSLLGELGLCRVEQEGGVIEERLPPPKGDSNEPFSEVLRILRHGTRGDKVQILSIDISEWMTQVNGRLFKEFLLEVERRMQDFVIVFRVPFVDKEVLGQVREALNDLVFVRTVSFPPFTKSDIEKCAKTELSRCGFKLSAAAWEGFHKRISEEKSDGRFYGLNTVKKVVRELLYKKQLDNARRGKRDFLISKRDTEALCAALATSTLSGYAQLAELVDGERLTAKINEIISQIELARADSTLEPPCIHMRFVGNPGTGKTTVARIVGRILKERGVLRVGNFFEYSGRDFCGRYIGETAPKTAGMCRDAYGSVLFIDEAYSLYRGDADGRDYGREALDTLIAEMENHRSDLVVIMAGYTEDMEKLMLGNAGLASRMPYMIEFPNFTREQLYEIFVSMVSRHFKHETELLSRAKEYFLGLPDEVISAKEFSNARFVRNLFERTWAKAAMRCQLEKIGNITLTKDDFERSVSDKEFSFMMQKKRKIGFM